MIEYDAHDWRDHLLAIRGSMIREISYRVLICVAWAALVVYVHENWVGLGVPAVPHQLVGVALGLLLVFRTNASYDRFWEGRKQWGSIVNETRSLANLSAALLAGDADLRARVLGWTIEFPWATMHALRGSRGLGPNAGRLPADEVLATLAAEHVPLAVARRITEHLVIARQRGHLSDMPLVALTQFVQSLLGYLGACERIRHTPLPFAYVVHLRRALICYCFTLPFALLDPFGWWTVPATLLIAYTLYGIEEIGVEIEDPFGEDDNDLPLEQICQRIEDNVRELMTSVTPTAPGAA
jgi:putative membrane protein